MAKCEILSSKFEFIVNCGNSIFHFQNSNATSNFDVLSASEIKNEYQHRFQGNFKFQNYRHLYYKSVDII